mmetsp:Transcript_20663/g.31525  ORF Transcript_20663/g.31525 Transcript_20663/m.31525 type:complete len:98 (+) Transcript_20663:645-938(+)
MKKANREKRLSSQDRLGVSVDSKVKDCEAESAQKFKNKTASKSNAVSRGSLKRMGSEEKESDSNPLNDVSKISIATTTQMKGHSPSKINTDQDEMNS